MALALDVIEHAALSDVGRARQTNEDALFASEHVFAVADGMGGEQAGEVASAIAIEAIRNAAAEEELPDRLEDVIAEANEEINTMAREDSSRAGMGCTLTVAVFQE